MFFRHAQHAARAAGAVVQGLHDTFGAENLAVRSKEQVDHQPDYFARHKVVAGRLVRCFVEAPNQVFEDQAHLVIGNGVGMQVDVGELPDDQVEPVGLVKLGDLFLDSKYSNICRALDEKLLM